MIVFGKRSTECVGKVQPAFDIKSCFRYGSQKRISIESAVHAKAVAHFLKKNINLQSGKVWNFEKLQGISK